MTKDTITPMQIRGARAQIGWTQDELATRAGVSVNSIKNIEAEVTQPRPAMMQKIRGVFENAGFEFLPHNGFQMRDDKIVVYENLEGYQHFYDDVYETARKDVRPIVVNGVDELLFVSLFKDRQTEKNYQKRMNSINHLDFRVIISEKDLNESGAPHVEYRSIPHDLFPNVTSYVYGDKVAVCLWGKPHRILVVNDKDMAEAYRINFEQFWQMAKPVRGRIKSV